MKKSIGYDLKYVPEKTEKEDKKCPYYGSVKVRGKVFEGTVLSDSMDRTVKIGWDTMVKESKYNRYLKKRTSVLAHNPDAINAKVGDSVQIAECRPLSKTKHFVVLKVVGESEK